MSHEIDEKVVSEEELDLIVSNIYERVLNTSNNVLRNCKRFSIEALREEDPTYEQIAEHLEEMCDILDSLLSHNNYTEHDWTFSKAKDYAEFVRGIAKAISSHDDSQLKQLIKTVDKWSFL